MLPSEAPRLYYHTEHEEWAVCVVFDPGEVSSEGIVFGGTSGCCILKIQEDDIVTL